MVLICLSTTWWICGFTAGMLLPWRPRGSRRVAGFVTAAISIQIIIFTTTYGFLV